MRTRRGLDRLLGFADAVVAIAITLLVLPLVDIATTAGNAGNVGVATLLRDHVGQLGALALSFLVIARLWLASQRLFEGVVAYDAVLTGLTFGWLLSLVFLPFPTELVAQRADQGATILYIGTLFVSSLCLSLSGAWLAAHPALRDPSLEEARAASDTDRDWRWTSPILLLAALIVASVVPGARMWSMVIFALSGPFDRARRRYLRRRAKPRAGSGRSRSPRDRR